MASLSDFESCGTTTVMVLGLCDMNGPFVSSTTGAMAYNISSSPRTGGCECIPGQDLKGNYRKYNRFALAAMGSERLNASSFFTRPHQVDFSGNSGLRKLILIVTGLTLLGTIGSLPRLPRVGARC